MARNARRVGPDSHLNRAGPFVKLCKQRRFDVLNLRFYALNLRFYAFNLRFKALQFRFKPLFVVVSECHHFSICSQPDLRFALLLCVQLDTLPFTTRMQWFRQQRSRTEIASRI